MVARGDLGIELPIEDVPMVQKQLLRIAGRLARPSITATQMLDSMVSSSRPTRAEVADVANAIVDGTDAVMLSQETAIGAYPVESVAMMAAVAERAERVLPYDSGARSACAVTRATPPTRRLQRLRGRARPAPGRARGADAVGPLGPPDLSPSPPVPIYALSPGRETVRRCSLMWGVRPARCAATR